MINGLFETHINVRNLERSETFYRDVLGLEPAFREDERRVSFFWMGPRGESMLGLWEKPPSEIVQQHFAFRSTVEDILHRSVDWLHERGLTCRNFLNDGTERPMVFGWMPAIAIYFDDPDGHVLELIAMLDDPPRPEVGVVSWDQWRAIQESAAPG
jgi:catechol 2,3-dioxygenase-like lactoylglutathione lyase family enzyme